MRKIKKLLSYTLVASILISGLMPGQVVVYAAENETASTTEQTTSSASTEQTSTQTTEKTTEVATGTTAVGGSSEEKTEATTETTTAATEATTAVTEATTEKATETTTAVTEATTEVTTATTTEATTEKATEATTEAPVSEYKDTGLAPYEGKVLVIDPGHCGKHGGAAGNGLKEEVVNMDISAACRDYLEKYGDITVYMTREDGTCCEALKVGECLSSRNNYAKQMGADFLMSVHINSGSSSGANVLAAYKSGYHDEIRVETQKFGKIALQKLSDIGVTNRGFLLRKSENGTRYNDGSLSDYYSIVRRGVVQRIPSVIIEHGYITSSSDCNKFFKTKAKRKKVGEADAKAVIEYFGLSKKVVEGTFNKQGDGTYFVSNAGEKMAGWVKQDGKWYYFDRMTGKQCFGFTSVDNKLVYLSPNTGELITGWYTVDSTRYLSKGDGEVIRNRTYSDGVYTYLFDAAGKQCKKKGFYTVAGATYYVDSKGHIIANGTSKIKKKYYGFDEEGKKLFGYSEIDGKYYYFDPTSGVMATKTMMQIDGAYYYFGSKGVRTTGFVTIGKAKYYFAPSTGKRVKGWKKISGKYYYFSKKTGKMAKSKWVGKYYVNAKGVRTKKK